MRTTGQVIHRLRALCVALRPLSEQCPVCGLPLPPRQAGTQQTDSIWEVSPEYGGRTFAQRFRQPWPAQTSFFKRHGFTEQKSSPVYALDVRSARIPEISIPSEIEIHPGFRWEQFRELASSDSAQEELETFELYFRSVDFDFSVTATAQSRLIGYLGFTIRSDTGFAELIAGGVGTSSTGHIRSMPGVCR